MKAVSSLSIALFATVSPMVSGFKSAEGAARGLVGSLGNVGSKALEITGIAGALGIAWQAISGIGQGFALAGELETAQVQLTALTGSADTAAGTIKQLKDLAASSPFAFPELEESSKKLLSVGVQAAGIPSLLKTIGNVAAGVGAPIGDIAEAFTRAAEEGSVNERVLKSLGTTGVPIMETLAEQFGTNAEGVKELAKSGRIGFGDLQHAFQSMTAQGGRFHGIIDAQNGTISGLLHTLSARVDDTLADVSGRFISAFNLKGALGGLVNLTSSIGPTVSSGIDRVAPIVQRFEGYAVSAFQSAYQTAAPYLSRTWDIVIAAWSGITSVVSSAAPTVEAFAGTVWSNVYNFVVPVVGGLYDAISTHWTAIVQTVVANGLAVWNFVTSAWTGIYTLASSIWDGISTVWAAGYEAITGTTVDDTNVIQTQWGTLITAATGLESIVSLAFNTAAFTFQNFRQVAEVVAVGIAFDVVRLGNQIEYVVTDVIPAGVNWCLTVFQNFAVATGNIFVGIATNIVSVMKNLPGLISGSTNWSDVWKPVTDGLSDKMKELPTIPGRTIGPLESALSDQLGGLQDKLGQDLGSYLADQNAKVTAATKGLTDPIKNALEGSGIIKAPEIQKPVIPKPDTVQIDAVLNPNQLAIDIKPKLAKAISSNSAEAQALRYGTRSLSIPLPANLTPNNGAIAAGSAATAAAGYSAPKFATPTPPAPNNQSAKDAGDVIAKQTLKDQLDQQKKMNDWLYRIELNTRTSTESVFSIF